VTRAKQRDDDIRVTLPEAGPPFDPIEAKLNQPHSRPGTVPRHRPVELLRRSRSTAPVVSVVAPAGYGKTTVVGQWAARDRRPFAWISLDERDNDVAVLLSYVAVALDRVEPIDPAVFEAIEGPKPPTSEAGLASVARAFSSMDPSVLVLDDVHLLHDPRCLEALRMLADHVPDRSQLVMVGREDPSVTVARLRATGRILEVGADELVMDVTEAGALLHGAGVDLADADVRSLTERTEGWPVGIYLGALSIKASGANHQAVTAFAGDDRFVADYLWSEILSYQSSEEVRFLTHSSVLGRMTGPLCDAVLRTTGSTAVLETLEHSNLLLVPLDRTRRWYRYHRLFGEGLRAQIERSDPALMAELRTRAADWCEEHDLLEDAVEYARAAGDADRVARIVGNLALPMYAAGRAATIEEWFDWLEERDAIERHPPLAVLGAWLHALMGRPAGAERWADAAARRVYVGPLPDGSPSMEGWLSLIRAALCLDGVARMEADASSAAGSLATTSQWRPTAIVLLGVARSLREDAAGADAAFADAAELGVRAGATGAASVALAERSRLAMERDDWDAAATFLDAARSVVRDAKLEEYMTSAAVYAAGARLALRRGDLPGARGELAHAQRLRPLLTRAFPYIAVQVRLELARVLLALNDPGGARVLQREITDLLQQRPDLGALVEQAAELRAQLRSIRGGTAGASTLTAAELRLLPLLPTHLSFREIGLELFVSQHTVKTQAISVYRKLGVTSRGAAIQRATELGLLAP
jgi:LuxR family maltose regulon positive regulatory protein